eukprot:TRINITY_DN1025_c0_g2_i1.p1 TRINITY_DN1025_c0_g2~~TRINITY_DN1025_c0_g2_i1.p1  ORF type:complete len:346 (+),score=111.06 TRINITY_DN1025_c0_g2_i1:25-1062(+)
MSRLRSNLSELDALLEGLQVGGGGCGNTDYTDYYSDLDYGESPPPFRPPPPDERLLSHATNHEQAHGMIPSKKKRRNRAPSSVGSGKSTLSIPSKPPHPPKLQHDLKNHVHDLVKATKRDDDILRAPDEFDEKSVQEEEDYSRDYGSVEISHPEEVDAGETPRGDASMVIHTDYGDLKSKYHYLGFGLWENTEPDEPPPPPRKLSPPPPPPKAEPIWYNCTVSLEEHQNTPEPPVEPTPSPEVVEEDPIEEPDIRVPITAFLQEEPPEERDYPTCFTCSQLIRGRIITARGKKFHPNCFVCSYCKKPFRNRQFKTEEVSSNPYCHPCFEKLLGHYGNVRTVSGVA